MTCHTLPTVPEGAFADDYARQPAQGADPSVAASPRPCVDVTAPRKGLGKGSPGYPRKSRNARSAVRNLGTRLPISDQMRLMTALAARDESIFHFVRRAIVALAKAEGIELPLSAADYTPRRPKASQLKTLKD